jgi:putative salt-induced outer membrane protein YdiY
MLSRNGSRVILFSLLACFCSHMAWADQVELKDGDRITGSIVKKDGDTVTLDSKNFGTVTFKWDDVATVRTDQPITVVLPNRTLKGNVVTQEGHIQIEAEGAPQSVALDQIVALRNDAQQAAYERREHPGVLDLWEVTGSLNLAGNKGNADTSTLTTPVTFVRPSNTSLTKAYFTSIRSTATIGGVSALTARAVRGGWSFDRNLTGKIFLNLFNDYEYDQFQALDLRVVLGSGLGYQFWKADRGSLALVAGGAWNREKFDPITSAAFIRNSAEAYWGDDVIYKLTTRTGLTQSFRMFNNLSSPGVYRMNFDTTAVTQLTKWLNWNVSLSDRYLSDPVSGRKNNDLLYTTGLGFTFKR